MKATFYFGASPFISLRPQTNLRLNETDSIHQTERNRIKSVLVSYSRVELKTFHIISFIHMVETRLSHARALFRPIKLLERKAGVIHLAPLLLCVCWVDLLEIFRVGKRLCGFKVTFPYFPVTYIKNLLKKYSSASQSSFSATDIIRLNFCPDEFSRTRAARNLKYARKSCINFNLNVSATSLKLKKL